MAFADGQEIVGRCTVVAITARQSRGMGAGLSIQVAGIVAGTCEHAVGLGGSGVWRTGNQS
jgi:hypothetical protein